MKTLVLLVIASGFASAALAQSIPVLPKEWKGTMTATSMGATNHHNPNHHTLVGKDKAPTGWNVHEEARTLTITRQEGRHLEATLKSPRGHGIQWVGTLSKDGKQIQVATKGGSLLFSLTGDSLSACGTGRGSDGGFEHWLNSFNAACFDFVAAK